MIPKRIFYVWGAGETKKRDVQVCIQTWRQVMPDYEIIEINQDNKDYFDFDKNIQESKFFRNVYQNGMWAFVADYIRVKVLFDYGGIYFDTDVSAVKPLDDVLDNPAFVGLQDDRYTEPAILGAEKGNLFLKDVLDFYENDFWNTPYCTIPQIFAYVLEKKYGINSFPKKGKQKVVRLDDISIYPQQVFIPFSYNEIFTPDCIKENTHTIHWFSGSWVKRSVVDFLSKKSQWDKIKLDKTLDVKGVYVYKFIGIPLFKGIVTEAGTRFFFCRLPVATVTENKVTLLGIKIFNKRELRK